MPQHFRFLWITLMLLIPGSIRAQFSPDDPEEPQVPVFYYALTATCDPDVAGMASGRGNYAPGTTVTVSTSARAGYTFSHWTLNGERISTEPCFDYTTVAGAMAFVAHYDLSPDDPAEPTMDVKSRLYLSSEPEGICTFNRTSGVWVQADQYYTIDVTNADQWYGFVGWYLNGTLLTTEPSFQYLADYADATLVARFRELPFTPTNPSEPESQGGDVQTLLTGDADGDGQVDVTDAVALINAYLGKDTDDIHTAVCDLDGDGVIDITDAVGIINLYLSSQ